MTTNVLETEGQATNHIGSEILGFSFIVGIRLEASRLVLGSLSYVPSYYQVDNGIQRTRSLWSRSRSRNLD